MAFFHAVTYEKASLGWFVFKLTIKHETRACGLLVRYYFKTITVQSSNISFDYVLKAEVIIRVDVNPGLII